VLISLSLKNVATISDTLLELGPGLNVLTGETGAGKSVLVEGLLLALGERADRSLVRPGSKLAVIEALFGKATGEEIIVRREVHAAGRSRMFLNDELVTLDEVRREVGALVDLHTQQSTPSLLHRRKQQEYLDEYAGASGVVLDLRRKLEDYRKLSGKREELSKALEDSEEERALLEHEKELIERLDPSVDDYTSLHVERKSVEKMELEVESTSTLSERLNSDHGISSELSSLLSETERLGTEGSELRDLISQAVISIQEAASLCSKRLAGLESAPWRLMQIDSRLDDYARLLSRCGGDIGYLMERKTALDRRIGQLDSFESELGEIESALPVICVEIVELSDRLTEARKRASADLQEKSTSELRRLNIPHAVFRIEMGEPSGGRVLQLDGRKICPDGAELPEFLFSANPGVQPASLSSVASGGEMSRVSLALRIALSSTADSSVLVFDEIDSGIGGETARHLADSLRRASESGRQVIVITHLAQIASMATTHLAVRKSLDAGLPVTEVSVLSGSGRIEELTRILGGGNAAREHALSLLSQEDG